MVGHFYEIMVASILNKIIDFKNYFPKIIPAEAYFVQKKKKKSSY